MSSINFADQLIDEMKRKQSRVIVGLDPVREHAPESMQKIALTYHGMGNREIRSASRWGIREFCERIIEATDDVAVAYKVQIAFFEKFGSMGLAILERLLEEYEDKLFIIDGKRGDIGHTSGAYAEAFFYSEEGDMAPLLCDAVTLNPYMGRDVVDPFMPYLKKDKGAFVLAKTSNPSSSDIQDIALNGVTVAESIAAKVSEWGADCVGDHGYSSLGLVVGATFPEMARKIREAAPKSIILVPGIGFQGGQANDAAAFCNDDGQGAVFSFSRSIIFANKFGPFKGRYEDAQYPEAARVAAEHYRVAINDIVGKP